MTPPISTRAVPAALAALCAITLAACSSSGPASDSQDPAAPTSSSAAQPAGAPTGPSGGATNSQTSSAAADSGSAAPGTPDAPRSSSAVAGGRGYCAESQLRATIDPRHVPGNGTAGLDGHAMKGFYVDFENTSSTSCVLYGYPGAATEDAAKHQLKQATRTLRGALGGLPSTKDAPSPVTVRPGHSAAALIEGIDTRAPGSAQAGCAENAPTILVTPPNTTVAVPFRMAWGVCLSLTVHPVQPPA